MQFFGQGKPPLGIIFDSDMGNGIDDALALALLYGFDNKSESRVVSLSVTKSNLKAAAFCDAVARLYSTAMFGQFAAFARGLPVGMATDGRMADDTPALTVPLGKKKANDEPVHRHTVHHLNDTADVAALIRNALTAQHDDNCVVLISGPASNIVKALALPGVKDLVSRKVRYLVWAAGSFAPGAEPEFNIKSDIAAARQLFAEWPGPIVASGHEIGSALLYPASSIEKDFAWADAHPVVDAYRAFRPMPYDAPTWAPAAALYAVRPKEGYFKLSEPGTINVSDDGRTRFTAGAEGRHRYLVLDPEQKERIVKTYTEIASSKPVQRQPRFRQQQQQQQQAPKPPEAKPPAP